MFRVIAPDAGKVRVRVGAGFDMNKGPDDIWTVITSPLVPGFHYYTLQIDGANVADPSTMTFFGSGWLNSGIEIPEPDSDADYYHAKDVPHGHVGEQSYYSKVTHRWRRAFVYTAPDYGSNANAHYPVLYLLHGWARTKPAGPDRAMSTSSWTA
jgi:enterochelin esterase family protein